jgi:hypothetical protein
MFGIVPSHRTLDDPFGQLSTDLANGDRAARSVPLADQLSVIIESVYACACAAAWCGSGWAWEGAATTIITKATPSISRPAAPVSHVALMRSLLITVILATVPSLRTSHARNRALKLRRCGPPNVIGGYPPAQRDGHAIATTTTEAVAGLMMRSDVGRVGIRPWPAPGRSSATVVTPACTCFLWISAGLLSRRPDHDAGRLAGGDAPGVSPVAGARDVHPGACGDIERTS